MTLCALLRCRPAGEGGEATAVDIGCAVGGASFHLARAFPHVLGIDFSQHFVNAANVSGVQEGRAVGLGQVPRQKGAGTLASAPAVANAAHASRQCSAATMQQRRHMGQLVCLPPSHTSDTITQPASPCRLPPNRARCAPPPSLPPGC